MRILLLTFLCFWEMTLYAQRVDSLQLMNDLKELSSDTYQGRKTGTYGGRLAQYYICNRFKEIGLKEYTENYKIGFAVITEKINKKLPDSILTNYKFLNGANIAGYIKGESTQTIVISAHFDHVGVTNGDIFNGADDNASGTCALLALAAYFKEHTPHHTLMFVAFDAEELGMQGSIAFISKPPIPKSDMVLNVNMDMIGTSTGDSLYIAGTRYSPQFKPQLKDLKARHKQLNIGFGYDTPNTLNNRLGRSDHAAFYVSHIPFLYFGVPEHQNYHQPSDDYENISHQFYFNTVNFILRTILEFDHTFPSPQGTSVKD